MGNMVSSTNPLLRQLEANQYYQQKESSMDPYVKFSQLGTYAKTSDISNTYAKSAYVDTTYAKVTDLNKYVLKTDLTSTSTSTTTTTTGSFIGVGTQSGPSFDLTITSTSKNSGRQLNIEQNVGKTIRIWYDSNGYLQGIGVSSNWSYPTSFGTSVTISALSSIQYTSAVELVHSAYNSGTYFKLLLWFTSSTPAGIPSFTSPKEAIRWIVLNKPSSVSGSYGGDGGGFLGYDNYTASVKFNS